MKLYRDLTKEQVGLIIDYLRNPSSSYTHDFQRRKELYSLGIHNAVVPKLSQLIGSRRGNIARYLKDVDYEVGTFIAEKNCPIKPLGEGIIRLFFEKLDLIEKTTSNYMWNDPHIIYTDRLGERVESTHIGYYLVETPGVPKKDVRWIYGVDNNSRSKVCGRGIVEWRQLGNFVECKIKDYHSIDNKSYKLSVDVEHEDLSSLVKRYRPICKQENKLLLFLLCEYEHTPTRENRINVDLWREEYLPEDKAEEYWIKGDKEIIRDVILGTDVANVLEVPLSDSDLKRKFSY